MAVFRLLPVAGKRQEARAERHAGGEQDRGQEAEPDLPAGGERRDRRRAISNGALHHSGSIVMAGRGERESRRPAVP
jgi:hypothetical protein